MEDVKFYEQRILALLSNTPYELCARLKQRLNQALRTEGYARFDERDYGAKKFAEFLQARLGDSVHLERPETTGDIRISLLKPVTFTEQSRVESIPRERPSNIRPDIWQAFTNPDLKRKRYFNLLDHRVLHFAEGATDTYAKKWSESVQDYLEIPPLSADIQVGWMRDFIESVGPDATDRHTLEALLLSNYSSGVNTAFTSMLGPRANEWRKLRMDKVTDFILTWASQHNVNRQDLSPKSHSESTPPPAPAEQPCHPQMMSARQQAAGLLERMSDEEIASIAIPVLLSSVLSKSQL